VSPPRQRRSQPRPRSSRRSISSLLFAVGCLAVLGVTFALGMAAGRRWPNGLPLPGFRGAPAATAAARTERDPKRPEARGLDKDKGKTRAEAPPVLTFYHELTAPMATPPPTTRPAAKTERAEAKPAETAKPVARPDTARPAGSTAAPVDTSLQDVEGTPPIAPPPAAAKGETKFTVQVGAFKVRGQAEALRARLAERGQEATVSEVEAAGVTQYRVRVGTFATREAAQEAAARLGSERRLSTYVTTR
jgi:cell division protein FtsN